ncbi:MAG TPA: tRNA (N(6)-L-threonylcarbamoyladenosine(37)-C(2))-methylthiotransferase [Candidatus Aenigmarchaeota archaeon]|nr:tRNA (N(6)-L-threonylcarbamoyladenosine(37)-C(2))-methylthiotransferase [Candidatus Aenigmarchaeota archaeon]HEX32901.1 tRNA (N(6)-L-threonylcarbamoyladenosine(37)-C(2))-methylthiotransferase [Candidatus Aenigmarchaeota archaeon]
MNFHIITYGCAANQADSEIMRHVLINRGHNEVDYNNANVVIVNTCGVKGPTEERIISKLKRISGKKVIIAGCLSWISFDRLNKLFPNYSIIGPDQVLGIADVVESDSRVVAVDRNRRNILIPTPYSDKLIIPISQGCLGACTYCATKFARGHLYSYKPEWIIKKVKEANGRVIYLTSQDCGAYGKDIGLNIVHLLKEVCKHAGSSKIRLGMMNPEHLLDIIDDLVDIYHCENMLKFAHIPVQSGSNKVLKDMNRKYTVEQFEFLVSKLRSVPGMVVSTDIIVGYPTETEHDFQLTMDLVRRVKPDVLNVSKFYPRPGTAAAKLKQLDTKVIKQRSRELSKLHLCLKRAKTFYSIKTKHF